MTQKKKRKKSIKLWGDGSAKRELLYVDDLAEACEFFLKKKTRHFLINIGSGHEKTILQYCKFLMKKFNIDLKIVLDKSKPNGTPRKIVNSKLAQKYGWKSRYDLHKGFEYTFSHDFKNI